MKKLLFSMLVVAVLVSSGAFAATFLGETNKFRERVVKDYALNVYLGDLQSVPIISSRHGVESIEFTINSVHALDGSGDMIEILSEPTQAFITDGVFTKIASAQLSPGFRKSALISFGDTGLVTFRDGTSRVLTLENQEVEVRVTLGDGVSGRTAYVYHDINLDTSLTRKRVERNPFKLPRDGVYHRDYKSEQAIDLEPRDEGFQEYRDDVAVNTEIIGVPFNFVGKKHDFASSIADLEESGVLVIA